MSSTEWSVRFGPDFESDIKSLKKRHYKKNHGAQKELDRFLAGLWNALAFNPLATHIADPRAKVATKNYPNGYAVDGAIFRNARFKMPSVRGSAQHGRVYFDVHTEARVVRVLGAYTHAEHEGDLKERVLIDRLKQGPLF